jgi:hypothetical protein
MTLLGKEDRQDALISFGCLSTLRGDVRVEEQFERTKLFTNDRYS